MNPARRTKSTLILHFLAGISAFNQFSTTEGTEFPGVLKSHVTIVGGYFPVSKDVVMDELRRRTSEDVCNNDYKFYFDERVQTDMDLPSSDHVASLLYVKYDHSDTFGDTIPCHVTDVFAVQEEYLWVVIPFLKIDEEGTVDRSFCPAVFTDSNKEVFFPLCGNNIYRIDSLNVEEDLLILRNGTDQLIARMTYDTDCVPAADSSAETWRDVRDSPFFSFSGPFNSGICDILGPNVTLCEVVQQNSCLLSRVGQDYCFTHDNVGTTTRCNASMELLEITGGFRQFLITKTAPPVQSLQAEWLDGDRSVGIVAPCLSGAD